MLELNQVYCGDCLEVMKFIDDKAIDMILCDLPYGTTACKWDTIIPFEPLWEQYKRIIKENGAIVLFGNQPFTSLLICSNLSQYKYNWVWNKNRGGNFVHSNYQPLRVTEDILVFGNFATTFSKKGVFNYRPQFEIGEPYCRGKIKDVTWNGCEIKCGQVHNNVSGKRFPKNIININNFNNKNVHPTQKPVALFEYLIKTYTNENELVLDNCAGSGTTGVACKNLKRNFILIEKDEKYSQICLERITNAEAK